MGGAIVGRNVLFVVDPEGTFDASPDEVELSTWSDDGVETWAAYRMQHADAKGRGLRVRVSDERAVMIARRDGQTGRRILSSEKPPFRLNR